MKLQYIGVLVCSLLCNAGFSQEMIKQDGYFNITEAGFLTGIAASYPEKPEYKAPNGGRIRTINGVFLSPAWSLGLGIGTDWYNRSHDDGLFKQYYHTAPIFLDARYYIRESRNTPFVFTDIGYSLNWGGNFDEGLMMNIGGGYKFFPGAKTCLVAALGYNIQRIQGIGNASSSNLNLHSASLQLGFLF